MAKPTRGKVAHLRTLYNHRLFGVVTARNLNMFQKFFPELEPTIGDRLLIRDVPMSDEFIKALG